MHTACYLGVTLNSKQSIARNVASFFRTDSFIFFFSCLPDLFTGNSWLNRKNFVKHPNKFYPLEIDYGQDEEELKTTIAPGSKSLLSAPIQELIKMIFDVESMKKTLVEFEVSLFLVQYLSVTYIGENGLK